MESLTNENNTNQSNNNKVLQEEITTTIAINNNSTSSPIVVGRIEKTELVRLLASTLKELNYPEVSLLLEKQSNIRASSERVEELFLHLQNENYSLAASLIDSIKWKETQPMKGKECARFLILQENFLHFIKLGNVSSALQQLQQYLSPFVRSLIKEENDFEMRIVKRERTTLVAIVLASIANMQILN